MELKYLVKEAKGLAENSKLFEIVRKAMTKNEVAFDLDDIQYKPLAFPLSASAIKSALDSKNLEDFRLATFGNQNGIEQIWASCTLLLSDKSVTSDNLSQYICRVYNYEFIRLFLKGKGLYPNHYASFQYNPKELGCLPKLNVIVDKENSDFSFPSIKSLIYDTTMSGYINLKPMMGRYKSVDLFNATFDFNTENATGELISYYTNPEQSGNIAIQQTIDTYSQIPFGVEGTMNPLSYAEELNNNSAAPINIEQNKILPSFDSNGNFDEYSPLNINIQEFAKEFKEKETYALNVTKITGFSFVDIPLTTLLSKLREFTRVSWAYYQEDGFKKSLSYKLIFDVEKNEFVYVRAAQMFQALYFISAYMRSSDESTINMYYDESQKNIIVTAKSAKIKFTTPVARGSFGTAQTIEEEIPCFAIIKPQPADEVSSFYLVDYLQFYRTDITFKEKEEILNVELPSPIAFTDMFKTNYPQLLPIYDNQLTIAKSPMTMAEKFDYVIDLSLKYLSTYTNFKEGIRSTKPKERWKDENYVLTVEECFWKYNQYTTEELLAYFITKGNDRGFRLLSLKILGVDYFLFYKAIANKLIDSKKLFVSNVNLDYSSYTSQIEYINAIQATQGNLYSLKEEVDDELIVKRITEYFGANYSDENQQRLLELIEEAESTKTNLQIKPRNTGSEGVNEALTLNVDLYSPMWFQSSFTQRDAGYRSSEGTVIENVISTSDIEVNQLPLDYKGKDSTTEKGGHIELFRSWLSDNKDKITGYPDEQMGFEVIYDSYILPMGKGYYIQKWILPVFKNKDKNPVGLILSGGDKFASSHISKLKWDDAVLSPTPTANLDLTTLDELGYTTKDSDGYPEIKDNSKGHKDLLAKITSDYRLMLWKARQQGRRLFNLFLKLGLDFASQQSIEKRWNTLYNNYVQPNLNLQPIFVNHSFLFGKKDRKSEFNLLPAQVEGVKHTTSRDNSGLLLHEVGFGKTTSSICFILSLFNTQQAKRALFIVPSSVYDKFQEEIKGTKVSYGIAPNTNVVLLGSGRFSNVRKLKDYTEDELKIIDKFKIFGKKSRKKTKKSAAYDSVTRKIAKALKGQTISLEYEYQIPNPSYNALSTWDIFRTRIKDELFSEIPETSNNVIVNQKMDDLSQVYYEVKEEVSDRIRILSKQIVEVDNGISSSFTDPKDIKKLKEKRAKLITRFNKAYINAGEKLIKYCEDKIYTISQFLMDEFGIYHDWVLEDKTILLATHNITEMIRPSNASLQRATEFRNGDDMSGEYETLNTTSDWRKKYANDSIFGAANSINTTHPLSFEKLLIDAIVVDEIHNFNNIIGNIYGYGIRAKERDGTYSGNKISNTYYDFTRYKKNEKTTRYNTPKSYPRLEKRGRAGTSREYRDMKYDSRWKRANKNKLNLTALCFDIQYKKPSSKNVVLLSATPFTDHPLQVLSVLGMSNNELLVNSGISNAYDFFNNYVDEIYKNGIRHDNTFGLFVEVDKYYNDKAISNLITSICNVKITDVEIEKNRPNKAIIPQNAQKNDVSKVMSSGVYFDILEEVTSKVVLTEAQKKMKKAYEEYLQNDLNNNAIYDVLESSTQVSSSGVLSASDEEVKETIKEQMDYLEENPDEYLDVITLLEFMLFEDRFKDNEEIKKAIKKIQEANGVEVEDEEEDVSAKIEIDKLDKQEKVKAKAVSVQLAQESLVVSPYLVPVGYKGSGKNKLLPDLEVDPPKVFVENSPKLLFVVKCIQETIKFQEQQLKNGEIDKIGGQVIYMRLFSFNFGGKSYNSFKLLADYIAKYIDGVSDEKEESGEYKEIGIIAGSIRDEDTTKMAGKKGNKKLVVTKRGKTRIRDEFNSGKIKILLGSQAIKEGIDLQKNAHTLYLCQAEFSPTLSMQLEGRIWRQGNPYDNVRIVYVLALNTIDAFIYDKLNKKVNNIKMMLEAGVYEMNNTQFTIDMKERLMSLLTDPEKLMEMEYPDIIEGIENKFFSFQGAIDSLKTGQEIYPSIKEILKYVLPNLQALWNYTVERERRKYKQDIYEDLYSTYKVEKAEENSKWQTEYNKLDKDQKKKITFKDYIKQKSSPLSPVTEQEVESIFKQNELDEKYEFVLKPETINLDTPVSTLILCADVVVKLLDLALGDQYSSPLIDISQLGEEGQREKLYGKHSFLLQTAKFEALKALTSMPMFNDISSEKDVFVEPSGSGVGGMTQDFYKSQLRKKWDYQGELNSSEFENLFNLSRLYYGIRMLSNQNFGDTRIDQKLVNVKGVLNSLQANLFMKKNPSTGKFYTFDDIDTVIENIQTESEEVKAVISDTDKFKADLTEKWKERLKNRKEKEDDDIDTLVQKFKKSEVLIKLRK